jgi:Icc protein
MARLNISRRDLMGGSLGAAVGALTGHAFASSSPSSKKSFRFAHLTDLHIHGRAGCEEARRAIDHALSRKSSPEMIITGGDLVYDSASRCERGVAHQWNHVRKAFEGYGIRTEHIVGNHDIWGLDREASGTTGTEPLYGKKWAMEELQLKSIYRSFMAGGWKFILLDDINPLPEKKFYEVRLDEKQFHWLTQEIEATPGETPIVIVSHAPILSANVFFLPLCRHQDKWAMPFALMNADAVRLTQLFANHSNVKLCLSGHTHLSGRVDYKNVAYVSHGAVCGNWWMGAFQGIEPGYGLVDLFSDGRFETNYFSYGARLSPA